MFLEIVTNKAQARAKILFARQQKQKIAFVPTMGALHQGHLNLIKTARKRADFLVVSIFVNPTQFAPNEDFSRYPRDISTDAEKLRELSVNLLFAPSVQEMYPVDFQTNVEVTNVTKGLCGENRAGHFLGVTTVVARLFGMLRPDIAVFGEKDYQQLIAIKTMSRDLAFDIEIIGHPTIREEDGLAMSSRNTFLQPEERKRAQAISRGLLLAVKAAKQGEKSVETLLSLAKKEIAPSVDTLQYLEIRDAKTLHTISTLKVPSRIFCAAFIGNTRLIDNMALE